MKKLNESSVSYVCVYFLSR